MSDPLDIRTVVREQYGAIARGNAHSTTMRPFVLPSPTNWAILLCLDPSAIDALHLTEEQ